MPSRNRPVKRCWSRRSRWSPQIGRDRCGPLVTVTAGQDLDPPRVLGWVVRLTRGSGPLVDRLCDCLEVGLGLLGRGGRAHGAVEGGGQGLGNGQGGKL